MGSPKYKVGQKVWIRQNIEMEQSFNGRKYYFNPNEKDIRGEFLEILEVDKNSDGYAYSFKNYNYLGEDGIDHEKTASGLGYWNENEGNTPNEPHYEIY